MLHVGDITKLSGYTLPSVDVITGGSPCQDLSIAGKRAGLAGERSGLFMEQMRIVREMRERDRELGRPAEFCRCRYMVWENVPGAFSSGTPKGSDFAAVIEEIVKVAEPGACVHVCVPDGGWTKSGCYYAEDGSWSIAWRLHDAQFWGVPQRRKRIALVADFGGLSAPEILFERKGMRRHSAESGSSREETAGVAGTSVEGTGRAGCLNPWDVQSKRVIDPEGVADALYSGECRYGGGEAYVMVNPDNVDRHSISFQERAGKPGGGKGILIQNERTGALSTFNNQSVFCLQGNGIERSVNAGCNGKGWTEDVSYTLNTIDRPAVVFEPRSQDGVPRIHGDISPTLNTAQGGQRQPCIYGVQSYGSYKEGVSSLRASSGGLGGGSENITIENSTIRRLTPLECERLQGFPDNWTDIGEWTDSNGKTHNSSDTARYKALGNSIALPFWQFLARRICAQYERPVTMASLFDGIGGFPLAFERAGARAVWASEIEEFPIAVTSRHFPEVD